MNEINSDGRRDSSVNDSVDIRFVFFDLGNVIVSFDPDRAVQNLSTRFGVSFDAANHAIYGSRLQDRFEHGEIQGDKFAEEIRRMLGPESIDANNVAQNIQTREILDLVSDMFTPIESMVNVVQRVRESGVAYGLLSNTCLAHWDWIARQQWLVSQLEWPVRILSCEVGSMKPELRIYEVAEQRSGVAARNLLFLDDKTENVEAARRRGWNAEVCLGGDQAISVLTKYNVGY